MEPFRPSRRFNLEDICDEATIERLEAIAEAKGITLEQVVWDSVDQHILREKGQNN